MPNPQGIADHNGENAEMLAAGYRTIDRNLISPALFNAAHTAADDGESLHILDIGCGSGDDAYALAMLGHHVVGVDPSDLLAIAQRDHAHPNIDYRTGTLPKLETIKRDEQFDIVMLNAVWQYIDPQDRIAALMRIGEQLRPGGKLIVPYPSPPSRAHQYEATPEMMEQALAEANRHLPKNRQLALPRAPLILEDTRGRQSMDGRPIQFYTFELASGHTNYAAKDGWNLTP